jgi:DNA-directed RNA polymerase subunit K/omega
MPNKLNKLFNESNKHVDISKICINQLVGGAKKIISDKSSNKEFSKNKDDDFEEEIEEEEEEIEVEETETESDVEDEDIVNADDIGATEEIEETEDEAEEEKESDVESKNDSDAEDNTGDKCYQKFSKNNKNDDEIDYDEYFNQDDDIIINKSGRICKPYLFKYERVRILGDRSRQLAQGAKPMIKNTTGLSHKEVAILELKSKLIPLIIERPIPNAGTEKWRLSELEILE